MTRIIPMAFIAGFSLGALLSYFLLEPQERKIKVERQPSNVVPDNEVTFPKQKRLTAHTARDQRC